MSQIHPSSGVKPSQPQGRIAALVAWAGRTRVGVLVLLFVLAALALATARHLELDALPDVTGNQVIVLTRAPGLTPEEIERTVTRPIEVVLGGLPKLVEQRSLSRYGISSVVAEFEEGADPWLARQQVGQALTTLAEMPAGVHTPELAPFTGGLGEVYQLAVTSSTRTPAELRELVVFEMAPSLRAVPGVVEVNIWGGERRTLDVVADPFVLARAGLSLSGLAEHLRGGTGTAPGSQLPAGPGQTLLRGVFWPASASELGAIAVAPNPLPRAMHETNHEPAPMRIADLGEVVVGAEPRIGAATANGRGEVVYVMVQMLRDANALEVTNRLHELLPELTTALPDDVTIDTVYDRSELVEATLQTVGKNLLEGAALVILVLFFMLGSFRAGLLVASVIPLSMLGALAWMVFFEIPGNLMSLGAIDFGLLVDGAVVMVERVFHEFAGRPKTAENDAQSSRFVAIRAMSRVAAPMTVSVLIITLVYIPILTLQGVDGKMFRPMALTVIFALTTSLVLALTYVPALASWLRLRDLPRRTPWLVRTLERMYRPILSAAMGHPARIAVLALGLLGCGTWAFVISGSSFVPQLDEGDLVIQTNHAPDISLDSSVAEALRLERAVLGAAPEVLAVASRIGSPEVATDIMGLEQADVFIDLAPRDTWRPGIDTPALIGEISEAIERDAPGGQATFTQPIQMRFNEIIGGSVTDVALSVYGEDRQAVRRTAEQIEAVLAQVSGAADVRILAPPSVSLVELRPQLLAASAFGMNTAELLDVVRSLRVGIRAGETWDGPVRIPIRLRLAHEGDAFTVAKIPVVTPKGQVVELGRLAEVEVRETPAMVNRHMARRRTVVGFNVRGGDLGEVVARAQQAVDTELTLPDGVRLAWGGQYAQLEEAKARLAFVIPGVLAAIFALLVIVFRRFGPAALIFSNIPFACVGGALALWARGMPISISAAIGFIALSGIAILNGVVLMSTLLERRNEGFSAHDAAHAAASERMRPVMMTALVAALGFVPMALATGVGSEVQRPLATVVVGGLVTSTFLSLVILPALFPWLSRRDPASPIVVHPS